ncbi:MAG: hypothetical protein ACHQ1G_00935, partial [Planctomycetota bacterium]
MVATREDDDPPPEPGRSSKRTLIILAVVLVAGALFVTQVLPLLIVLWPVSRKPAQRLQDTNDLRNIAGLIIIREDVPLAPDGRIDIYAILRQEKLGMQAIVDICHSSRAGKGPTWEEIEAGDYRNFPYQRHRGVLDRKSYVRVPVVWDLKPSEDRLARGS